MKTNKTIRIKVIANMCENVSFLTVRNGEVQYFGANETPFALSNIAGENAAQLRFALEDCRDASEAVKVCRRLMQYAKTVTLI